MAYKPTKELIQQNHSSNQILLVLSVIIIAVRAIVIVESYQLIETVSLAPYAVNMGLVLLGFNFILELVSLWATWLIWNFDARGYTLLIALCLVTLAMSFSNTIQMIVRSPANVLNINSIFLLVMVITLGLAYTLKKRLFPLMPLFGYAQKK